MEKWLGKNKAYYGKPIQLFKDSDKDGVMNVFDCKPYNKKKQDVIMPPGNVEHMIYRGEQNRQTNLYNQKVAQFKKQEGDKQTAIQKDMEARNLAFKMWKDNIPVFPSARGDIVRKYLYRLWKNNGSYKDYLKPKIDKGGML